MLLVLSCETRPGVDLTNTPDSNLQKVPNLKPRGTASSQSGAQRCTAVRHGKMITSRDLGASGRKWLHVTHGSTCMSKVPTVRLLSFFTILCFFTIIFKWSTCFPSFCGVSQMYACSCLPIFPLLTLRPWYVQFQLQASSKSRSAVSVAMLRKAAQARQGHAWPLAHPSFPLSLGTPCCFCFCNTSELSQIYNLMVSPTLGLEYFLCCPARCWPHQQPGQDFTQGAMLGACWSSARSARRAATDLMK